MRPVKVGHTGTLDPLATGVLVVAIGRATRLVQYVQKLKKRYVATFQLGKTSDTEDVTGQITMTAVDSPPDITQVTAACQRFVGPIRQRPPAFSAIHVQGRRAYNLARQGKVVALQERPIVVDHIDVVTYQFPELTADIGCGSGTYIRSLGRDIGEELGCGAVMSELRRLSIGSFAADAAQTLGDLEDSDSICSHLYPIVAGVEALARVTVRGQWIDDIAYGRRISLDRKEDEIAAVSEGGELLAVLISKGSEYRPKINFISR